MKQLIQASNILSTELDAFCMLIFNIHDLKLVLHLFNDFYT